MTHEPVYGDYCRSGSNGIEIDPSDGGPDESLPGSLSRGDWRGVNIKQTFDDAMTESEEVTAVLRRAHCRSFRQGAQECREMLARFVEQGGDAVTAASIRANWNPEWGENPGPPKPR